jgi:5'-deoxynucleotidase YfbR-like HD superfamily hydrolase
MIENLLNGVWKNLVHVNRYQTHVMIKAMTVAEHSWITGMLSLFIFNEVEKNMQNDCSGIKAEILVKALVHDLEECVIGDIPLNEVLRNETKTYKDNVGKIILNKMLDVDENIINNWRYAKSEISGLVVQYSDMLSALLEMIQEKDMGNTYMDKYLSNPVKHLINYEKEFESKIDNMIGVEGDTLQSKFGREFLQVIKILNFELVNHMALKYGIKALATV